MIVGRSKPIPVGMEVVGYQHRHICSKDGPGEWMRCDSKTAEILDAMADFEVRPLLAMSNQSSDDWSFGVAAIPESNPAVRFERVRGATSKDWASNISPGFSADGDCVLCWVNLDDFERVKNSNGSSTKRMDVVQIQSLTTKRTQ